MKTNLRYFSLIIISIFLILAGCTRYIKPQKFDLNTQILKPLRSNVPIQVLVPKDAETKYLIEFSGKQKTHANVYVDLNDLYKNAKELIEETLVKHKVPFHLILRNISNLQSTRYNGKSGQEVLLLGPILNLI